MCTGKENSTFKTSNFKRRNGRGIEKYSTTIDDVTLKYLEVLKKRKGKGPERRKQYPYKPPHLFFFPSPKYV